MKTIYWIFLFLFSFLLQLDFIQNQAVVDSIEKVLVKNTDVELRVDLLLLVSSEYLRSYIDKRSEKKYGLITIVYESNQD